MRFHWTRRVELHAHAVRTEDGCILDERSFGHSIALHWRVSVLLHGSEDWSIRCRRPRSSEGSVMVDVSKAGRLVQHLLIMRHDLHSRYISDPSLVIPIKQGG